MLVTESTKGTESSLDLENQERQVLASLMADLSAQVINKPADQVDKAIEEAQRELCEALGLDRSSLFQRKEDGSEALLLTHLVQALAKSHAEIRRLKDRLQAESEYLRSEIKVNQPHGEIIGRSEGLKNVLQQIEQVAPVDCAVLISGETGTGKELIAQEIHRLSPRRERLMVLVNCAALPSALVESELFGRERGAYTGALTSQVGHFELADGSTIFLDEVGELSMEVQAKLLRVLQQGEFQRLGSPKTHKVDVRVIAATNRDLAADVRKGRFREDLYYRLKVFPIEIPPLRERVEDIPLLVFAFMEGLSARMGKKITKVPRKAMEALQKHSWPGNIRELRNVIEHSVILSSADTLKLSFLGETPTREVQAVTLAEAEREHILKTLEGTAWRIKGPHGAARRLDLQPSTLYSRMQKLGIPHRRQKDQMAVE
jgi:transcriptional regulator with GAF, ATPase, and Fis domain